MLKSFITTKKKNKFVINGKKNINFSRAELERELSNFLLRERLVTAIKDHWIQPADSDKNDLVDILCEVDPVTVLSVFWQVVVSWTHENIYRSPEDQVSVHNSVNGILGWLVYFAMDMDRLKLLPVSLGGEEFSYFSVPVIDELGVEIYVALSFGFRASFLGDAPYIRGKSNLQNYNEGKGVVNNGWGPDVSHGVARAAWNQVFKKSYKGNLSPKDMQILNKKLKWKKQ